METPSSSSSQLTDEMVSSRLQTLGIHPLLLKHSFLELKATDLGVEDIAAVSKYRNLMYIDLSRNCIRSLKALESISALVQLRARGNNLTECLDFTTPWCNAETSWEDGNQAVGSMLALADLRENQIKAIRDLSDHHYLECLLLGHNKISSIGGGLCRLRYLQTLDLSHNNISFIEGLDDLPIRELNLSHNRITSVEGLGNLPCLSALNISHNRIVTLAPLQKISTLTYVDASHNAMVFIRQVEFLSTLPWMQSLAMHDNPCFFKPHYRLRVIFRLTNLQRLDNLAVSLEEKVRAHNLYRSPDGDLMQRERTFAQFCPRFEFVDHSPAQLPEDDEAVLSIEQLGTDPGVTIGHHPIDAATEEAATQFFRDVLDSTLTKIQIQ